MLQLAAGEDYGIDQLLDLGVTCLSLREYFTDKIDWPLDWQRMALLLPFDYHRCTDNLGRRGDVKEKWFRRLRWD